MIVTSIDFSSLTSIIQAAAGVTAPAIQVEIRQNGTMIYSQCAGWLDPDQQQRPVQPDSLFDLASVTKLFTTTAFMRMVERGSVQLDQPVSTILPQFTGMRPILPYEDPLHWGAMVPTASTTVTSVDAGRITFRQLLCHNSGLPAWRPFKDQPNAESAKQLALNTPFYYPTGSRIVYSDVGLILLGMAMEKIGGLRLDALIGDLVMWPLGLESTRFLPISGQPYPTGNIAPTEFCKWRNRRVLGVVHDENAARLEGIAGHAGLFSNAHELARFGQLFLDSGAPLLQPSTVTEMTRLQAEDGAVRRGIGFALWSPDPEASSNPFSQQTFGHTGFTGTSLWIDPTRLLVTACLTNRVYYGRDASAILAFRVQLAQKIVELVDACSS